MDPSQAPRADGVSRYFDKMPAPLNGLVIVLYCPNKDTVGAGKFIVGATKVDIVCYSQTGANGEDYLKCDSEADVDGLKKLLDFEADGEDNQKYCEADEEGYEKYNQIMMMSGPWKSPPTSPRPIKMLQTGFRMASGPWKSPPTSPRPIKMARICAN